MSATPNADEYIHIYMCIYIHMYICTCIYIYVCTCRCIYIYICMYIYIYVYIFVYVHVKLCMYTWFWLKQVSFPSVTAALSLYSAWAGLLGSLLWSYGPSLWQRWSFCVFDLICFSNQVSSNLVCWMNLKCTLNPSYYEIHLRVSGVHEVFI